MEGALIVGFFLAVMLGSIVSITLSRTGRSGVIIAGLTGTAIALTANFVLLLPHSWNWSGEVLVNRLLIYAAFSIFSAAIGSWMRKAKETT